MANQTAANILVALKREDTFGVQLTTVTGANQLRIIDSPGLTLQRAVILSQEKRADGNTPMGRQGYKSVQGSYNCELSVGGAIDSLLEAIMRTTYTASASHTSAEFTSISIASNVITAAAGSFITQGYRVGQVIRLSGTDTAANDNLNLFVTAVTASTLTVAGATLTDDAGPDTGFTITRLKHAVNNTTAPTRYSYQVEQYDKDIDLSELFLGVRLASMRLSFRPGAHATVQWGFVGADRTALASGTSPFFTSPSVTTGLSLVADDSAILYNGSVVTNLTGFDLEFDIATQGEPTIGSLVTPDIFDNNASAQGTVTGIRQDFSNLTLYDAETEFALAIKLEEPGSTPAPVLGFFLPRVKISGLSAPVGGGDGAKIETINIMAGPIAAATGQDETLAVISSSAA